MQELEMERVLENIFEKSFFQATTLLYHILKCSYFRPPFCNNAVSFHLLVAEFTWKTAWTLALLVSDVISEIHLFCPLLLSLFFVVEYPVPTYEEGKKQWGILINIWSNTWSVF